MMLTRLKIKNFKSIGEEGVDLDLKPLTILVGPNGSGKSSILEALCLLAAQRDASDFRLGGELVRFSGLEEIAHKHELSRWMLWEVAVGGWAIRYEFKPDSSEEKETVVNNGRDYLQLKREGDRRSGLALRAQIPGEAPSEPLGNILTKFSGRPFLSSAQGVGKGRREFQQAAEAVEQIGGLLERIFRLGPNRGEIPSQAGTGDVGSWVGIAGEKLLPILSLLTASHLYELQWAKIIAWAEQLGLLRLRAGLRGPNILAADFLDPELKTTVNLAFAGYGSKQAAVVITQLFWAPSGSIIMIEEPEMSLHPEAQLKLAELFAEAIKEDKQIIATTHSYFLPRALEGTILKDLLKPEDVAIYEVTKESKVGTRAQRLPIAERGTIKGWIPSFDKVEKKLLKEWLESRPKD